MIVLKKIWYYTTNGLEAEYFDAVFGSYEDGVKSIELREWLKKFRLA